MNNTEQATAGCRSRRQYTQGRRWPRVTSYSNPLSPWADRRPRCTSTPRDTSHRRTGQHRQEILRLRSVRRRPWYIQMSLHSALQLPGPWPAYPVLHLQQGHQACSTHLDNESHRDTGPRHHIFVYKRLPNRINRWLNPKRTEPNRTEPNRTEQRAGRCLSGTGLTHYF